MTESRQSKTPGASAPSSSHVDGSHFVPENELFLLPFASVRVGCAGSIVHVLLSTKNLYWTGLPYGTFTSTDHVEPFFAIGLPVTHVSGPPKSPRSSTELSLPAGYVNVCAQRFSSSGHTNGVVLCGPP